MWAAFDYKPHEMTKNFTNRGLQSNKYDTQLQGLREIIPGGAKKTDTGPPSFWISCWNLYSLFL